MSYIARKVMYLKIVVILIFVSLILSPGYCQPISDKNYSNGVRGKRGAAYAGGHPGSGYGVGGVGIPGLRNALQYSAYNTLLTSGNHGGSGYGSSSHGRKLTVDQAIGMFGHHTLNRQYPYTAEHGSGGGGHSGGGHGGGYSGGGGGGHGGGYSSGGGGGHGGGYSSGRSSGYGR